MPEQRRFDLPLALTMGEPAGVGGELACLAWRQRTADDQPFVLIDDAERLVALNRQLQLEVTVRTVADPDDALDVWHEALPVLDRPLSRPSRAGHPDPSNASCVVGAIDEATKLAMANRVAAVVTNPIQKNTLYEAGFRFPGHTEYLAEITGTTGAPVMMLTAPGLRVALVTIHLPLADAVASLSTDAIVATGHRVADALRRDFGLSSPRLVVAGLNPHAGEGGALGHEEIDVIAPAVAVLQADGIDAAGPFPADTMFHVDARAQYDAAICMYHDQALIPLKTIDFWRGVNITLGLPIIRTSPDHGTALDLAGTGKASPQSLLAALRTARDMAAHHRREVSASTAATTRA